MRRCDNEINDDIKLSAGAERKASDVVSSRQEGKVVLKGKKRNVGEVRRIDTASKRFNAGRQRQVRWKEL